MISYAISALAEDITLLYFTYGIALGRYDDFVVIF